MKSKKIISLVIAAVLLGSIGSFAAFAEENEVSQLPASALQESTQQETQSISQQPEQSQVMPPGQELEIAQVETNKYLVNFYLSQEELTPYYENGFSVLQNNIWNVNYTL